MKTRIYRLISIYQMKKEGKVMIKIEILAANRIRIIINLIKENIKITTIK